MDIAKIRKKALSKDHCDKPVEQAVPSPAETQKVEALKQQEAADAAEVKEVPPEEMPAVETSCKNEDRSDVTAAEEIAGENVELVELLIFSLSDEEYAFRVSDVEEVLRMQKITMLPTMPAYVLGITSLRGKIIPVIDLKTRLNLDEKSLNANGPTAGGTDNPETRRPVGMKNKILIISGARGLIGATIDRVVGVVRLPLNGMLKPPGHLDERELRFIEGIVVIEKRFISIINSGAAMDIEAG